MKNCVHQPIVVANEYFEGNKMFGCWEIVKKCVDYGNDSYYYFR